MDLTHKIMPKKHRREVLKSLALTVPATFMAPYLFADSPLPKTKVSIGACDWSIGMHSNPEAIRVASEIGLDGVQVSLGKVNNDMHLRKREIQQQYKTLSKKYEVKISSLAIGELNQVPYKSDPRTDQWVSDSIDVAHDMNCEVILLAFFGKGDLKNDEEGTKRVIEKLQKVVPKAEDAGIILGIESWLDAKEHVRILEEVNSPNVQVYYDVANSNKMGYDIYEEIKWLGKDRICELHMKENGFLLGEGLVDFPKVRKSIDILNYKGWVQIEGAVPEGKSMMESYIHNLNYLREIYK